MLGDPSNQLTNGLAVSCLRRELRAELALATVTTQREHHVLCDVKRDCLTIIFFQHGEREVGASRDACARPDVSILNENAIRIDRNLGISTRELFRGAPVCGCTTAVKNAGSGQHERTGTD